MRRCDEHRCHFHDCTERRDRSDYCPDHKCRFDGCRDGVTNGLGHYCARHEIFRDGGGVGVRPSAAIPPCLFDGCDYPSLSGRRYCRFHECEVRECTLPLMAGVSNFASSTSAACAQLDCEDRALNGGWCDTHWTRRRRRRRTGSQPPGVWFEGAGDHNGDDLDYLDYGDDDDDDDGYDGERARRRSRARETPGRGGSPARVCLFRTGSGPVPDRICNQRAERGRQYCTRHLCRDYHCDAPARGETSYFCRHHECERDGCRRKVHGYDGPGFTMPGPSFVCARHRRCAIEGCGRDVDGYVIDALCSRHRYFGGPFRGSEGLL
ncbi:hypothetical protein ACCO45_004989 [Purpureocillium lilacinum]|uniref:Uncharacterized protein n=1 Tax=Purpureocillium lilacinum TaxID=33203 RepID=A0ACC4DU54_PURLI